MCNNTSLRNVLNSEIPLRWKLPFILCFWCPMNSTRQKWWWDIRTCDVMREGSGERHTGRKLPHGEYNKQTVTQSWDLPVLTDWVSRGGWSPDSPKTTFPVNNREGSRWGSPTVWINWKELEKHWASYLPVNLSDYWLQTQEKILIHLLFQHICLVAYHNSTLLLNS